VKDERIRNPALRALFSVLCGVRRVSGRASVTALKAMIMAEGHGKDGRQSLSRLFEVRDQLDEEIDRLCIEMGDGIHMKHQWMEGIHTFFTERIPAGAVVLDVGCGVGVLAHELAVHSEAHVVGVDINGRSIAFARSRFQHPRLEFREGNVLDGIDLPHADVIVLSSVLEHLERRAEFLSGLASSLKPVLFLIRVPMIERNYFVAVRRAIGLPYYADKTHVTEYTETSFDAEMTEAGLVVRHKEIRWGDLWAECQAARKEES